MADETQTTGTPEQDGGDAASEPTTGTPVADGRNAESDERWKEALVWKDKAERLNATEAELNRLRAAQEAAPRTPSPAGDADFERKAYEADVANWVENAQDAQTRRWARNEQIRLENERRLMSENQFMQQVVGLLVQHPAEDARAILKEMESNPQKYSSINDAQREIDLRRKNAEIAKLQQEVKRMQNQNAVPTAGRETQPTVPELNKAMTGSAWRRRQAGLSQEQAYAEQAQHRKGEIKIDWHS